MSQELNRLLTVRQAEIAGPWKESTLRKKILKRQIPYVKCGRSVRIPAEFIEQLVKDGLRETIPLAEKA